MSDAFLRLLRMLALERKQGYRNKAVIGGLDKFVGRWEADARAEAADAPAIKEIVALLLGYPAVADTAARQRIVEQIIRRVREIAPEAVAAEAREADRSPRRPAFRPRPAAAAETPAGDPTTTASITPAGAEMGRGLG